MTREFDPKDPAEIVPLVFDFENLTVTPVNPVITVSRESGPKGPADLSGMLAGAAQISDATIRQRVQGGTAGTVYKIRCQVDDGAGGRFVIAQLLPVETA